MDFDKIVRDKVPDICRAHGKAVRFEVVGEYQALRYLAKKVSEEAGELEAAIIDGGEDHIIEEMGDVIECIFSMAQKLSIHQDRIGFVRANKAAKNGAFDENIILKFVSGEKF